MRQAIGLGFESRRAQKKFSVRDILSRFYQVFVPAAEIRFQNRDKCDVGTGTNGPISECYHVLFPYRAVGNNNGYR